MPTGNAIVLAEVARRGSLAGRSAAGSPRPVLKWAGGKRRLLPYLLRMLPDQFERYIEPMVGGGALFFALAPDRAVISDSNPELINFYRVLVARFEELVSAVEQWPLNEETYYRVRDLRFEALDPVTAAARLLYLNRTCFNGLYRVNSEGRFNVPWGRYGSPNIIDRQLLEAAHRQLTRAQIELGDYRDILTKHAAAGDLVFLDPPYLPISSSTGFRRYTPARFYARDHEDMRAVVEMLRNRGCMTILTNANHPLMHDLYQGFPSLIVKARRSIVARGEWLPVEDIIIRIPPR